MQHSQGCWPKKKPSQQVITNQLLIDGAPAPAEGQLSTTLAAELWFILVSTAAASPAAAAARAPAAAAKVCRQTVPSSEGAR